MEKKLNRTANIEHIKPKNCIRICKIDSTMVPAAVNLGVAYNRKALYLQHLENIMTMEVHQKKFRELCYIYALFTVNKDKTMICNCKNKEFHGATLYEFFEKNEKVLDACARSLYPALYIKLNQEEMLTKINQSSVS